MKNLKNNLIVQEINTEKYITFSIPIEKEVTKTDKKGNEITNLLTMENL